MVNSQSSYILAHLPLFVRRSDQYEYFTSLSYSIQINGNSKVLNRNGAIYSRSKTPPSPPTFLSPLIVDYDGNRKVRDEIKRTTGHIVSQGASSTIKNYTIAHIWGETYHPDCFSFLWNICLIPSWAAFISDKKATSYHSSSPIRTFIQTFQDTLKSIANTLYPGLIKRSITHPVNVHGKTILMVDTTGSVYSYTIP